jgi:hypothetical protein
MDKVALGDPFTPKIQSFLQGKLPEPTSSEQPLKPATTNTIK